MEKQDKPGWVQSYNMASLLNVPDAMERFGPLVDLWEGKIQVEGIVTYVKEEIKTGLQKEWSKRLLDNLNRQKAMRSIMRGFEGKDREDPAAACCRLDAYMYGSEATVTMALFQRKPRCLRIKRSPYGTISRERYLSDLLSHITKSSHVVA